MKKESFMSRLLKRRIIIMVLLFVVLLVFFSVMSKGIMLKPKNLVNILNSMSITTFLTVGVAMLMISGRLDLSTGASGTLCGMMLAFLLREGLPLVPALAIVLVLGIAVGIVNAALVNELNMAPFIATLATSSAITGLIYLIADKKTIEITNTFLKAYGNYKIFGYIPVAALFAFILMIIVGLILHKTKFGRQIYLVGGNPNAAMLSGINPKKMSYILFAVCGLFSSLAGITLVSRASSATIAGLVAQRFQGITAAVLGGISFGGGSGGMAGAFVGLLVLNTFSNGMIVIGVGPYWQNVASGMLLIFALTLDFLQKKQNMKTVA